MTPTLLALYPPDSGTHTRLAKVRFAGLGVLDGLNRRYSDQRHRQGVEGFLPKHNPDAYLAHRESPAANKVGTARLTREARRREASRKAEAEQNKKAQEAQVHSRGDQHHVVAKDSAVQQRPREEGIGGDLSEEAKAAKAARETARKNCKRRGRRRRRASRRRTHGRRALRRDND